MNSSVHSKQIKPQKTYSKPGDYNAKAFSEYQAYTPESFFGAKLYQQKTFKWLKNYSMQNKNTKMRLLEIGCADGSFSELLKSLNFTVTGIDVSTEMIKLAKLKGITAFTHDVSNKLPFADGSFQAVVATEVIEHLYDTDFFLSECWRVLSSNGVIILTTPNLASVSNRLALLFGKYPRFSEYRIGHGAAGHIHNYTLPVLAQQLKQNNFLVLYRSSPNFIFPVALDMPFIFKRFAMFLGDILPNFGSHMIVAARKSERKTR
jgi:2-polyprenyl-3-methyl-5-hydroxy-6-metoxy-1,4-benzoquinol methylase